MLSEPTRGMDVGAKDDVVRIVRGLARQGVGIIVVSTEPETVLSLADRILVMKKGAIVREFAERDDQQGPAAGSGVRNAIPISVTGPERHGRTRTTVSGSKAALAEAASCAISRLS